MITVELFEMLLKSSVWTNLWRLIFSLTFAVIILIES